MVAALGVDTGISKSEVSRICAGLDEQVAACDTRPLDHCTGPLVHEQVEVVATMLEPKLPDAAMPRRAREEITAFADFPEAHWPKIWSSNPLERLNREVKRRTEVVGIFPNPAALHRLTACVLIEAHDEWQVADRRYLSEGSMALLTPPAPTQIGTSTTNAPEVIDTPAAVTA